MKTEIIISICSLSVSAISLIISLCSFFRQQMRTVNEFFLQCDNELQKSCRKEIYKIPDNCTDFSPYIDLISQVVSFYDCWAMLVKRKYLPIWVFDGMAGDALTRQFGKIYPYILQRRESGDTNYAIHFEWLSIKLSSRYK